MPVLHIPFRGRANLRNHRKIVVVDSRVALTGGMNLALPYMGPTSSTGLWRDLSALVEGPGVFDLESLFVSDWAFATGEDLSVRAPAMEEAAQRSGTGDDAQRRDQGASSRSSPADPMCRTIPSTRRCCR